MSSFDNIDLICDGSKQPYISVGRFAGGFTSGKNTFIYDPRFDCFIRLNCVKYIKGCNTIDEVKEAVKSKKKHIVNKSDNQLDILQQSIKF